MRELSTELLQGLLRHETSSFVLILSRFLFFKGFYRLSFATSTPTSASALSFSQCSFFSRFPFLVQFFLGKLPLFIHIFANIPLQLQRQKPEKNYKPAWFRTNAPQRYKSQKKRINRSIIFLNKLGLAWRSNLLTTFKAFGSWTALNSGNSLKCSSCNFGSASSPNKGFRSCSPKVKRI